MSRHDDPAGVIAWVEEKAAQVTGIPVSHGEVSVCLTRLAFTQYMVISCSDSANYLRLSRQLLLGCL